MSLTSQIVTAEFPDLEKVERLNTEAFPEEERTPLSELLRYGDGEYSHFYCQIVFEKHQEYWQLPE